MKRYTEYHEWVEVNGQTATVGITDYAQKELGEIVYVELPEVGKRAEAGKEAAVLESTKAAADVYAPISGKVTAVNEALRDAPKAVNLSAEAEGWLFKLAIEEPSQLDALLDSDAYAALVKA